MLEFFTKKNFNKFDKDSIGEIAINDKEVDIKKTLSMSNMNNLDKSTESIQNVCKEIDTIKYSIEEIKTSQVILTDSLIEYDQAIQEVNKNIKQIADNTQ